MKTLTSGTAAVFASEIGKPRFPCANASVSCRSGLTYCCPRPAKWARVPAKSWNWCGNRKEKSRSTAQKGEKVMMRTRVTSTIVLGLLTFGLLVVSGTPATAVEQCEMQGNLSVSNGVNVGQATTAGTGQVFLKNTTNAPRVLFHSLSGTTPPITEGKWVVCAYNIDGSFRIANDLGSMSTPYIRLALPPSNRASGTGVDGPAVKIFNLCSDTPTSGMQGLYIQCGAADQTTGTHYYLKCYANNYGYVGGLRNVNGTFQIEDYCDARGKTSITRSPMKGLEIVKGIPVSRFRYGKTGTLQDGFVAQDVEKFYPQAVGETTDQFPDPDNPEQATTQTMKTLYPLALIAPLYRSVQELDERMALLEGKPDAASSAAFANMAITQCLEQKALKPEAAQGLAEAVLEQLGINPWVEIPAVEAFEEADETTTITVVETATKYRPNFESRSAESYTVEETVVKQQPTGRKIVQLKAGVRCDEKTGKFYRWVGLSSADAEKLAALRTANQLTALQVRFVAPSSGGQKLVVPSLGGLELVAPPLGGQKLVATPSGGVLSASASAASPANSKLAAR